MPVYLHDQRMIGLEEQPNDDAPWLRVDVCVEPCLGFDMTGYPKLGPEDCRILAQWLLRQADAIDQRPREEKKTVTKKSRVQQQRAADKELAAC